MLSKGSESVLLVCWIGLAHASCASSNFRHDTYHPRIDVADFRSPGENLVFPLVPGTTLKYVEKERGAVTENEVTVTHDILKKLSLVGMDLDEYSLDTVKMFRDDAVKAGFSL